MGGAFTVEELAARVRLDAPGTGLATIYRAVAALDASGWLARVGVRDGSVLYARCTADAHHHHLVCTRCGRVEATPCPLDSVVERARREAGFEVTSHEVTLYGICRSCGQVAAGGS